MERMETTPQINGVITMALVSERAPFGGGGRFWCIRAVTAVFQYSRHGLNLVNITHAVVCSGEKGEHITRHSKLRNYTPSKLHKLCDAPESIS